METENRSTASSSISRLLEAAEESRQAQYSSLQQIHFVLCSLKLCSGQTQEAAGYLSYLQEQVLPTRLRALPTAVVHCWAADAKAEFNCYGSTTVKETPARRLSVLVSLHNTEGWICFLQSEIRPARFWISSRRNVQNPALKMEFGLSRAVANGLCVWVSHCRHLSLYVLFISKWEKTFKSQVHYPKACYRTPLGVTAHACVENSGALLADKCTCGYLTPTY